MWLWDVTPSKQMYAKAKPSFIPFQKWISDRGNFGRRLLIARIGKPRTTTGCAPNISHLANGAMIRTTLVTHLLFFQQVSTHFFNICHGPQEEETLRVGIKREIYPAFLHTPPRRHFSGPEWVLSGQTMIKTKVKVYPHRLIQRSELRSMVASCSDSPRPRLSSSTKVMLASKVEKSKSF